MHEQVEILTYSIKIFLLQEKEAETLILGIWMLEKLKYNRPPKLFVKNQIKERIKKCSCSL